ncbi:hypothetical protein ABZ326_19990 [Streptomyces californicus]|uniref:hypothetical protein n=1 Tax=Streptomyces TaxID=1883 RepID=UPI001EF3AB83
MCAAVAERGDQVDGQGADHALLAFDGLHHEGLLQARLHLGAARRVGDGELLAADVPEAALVVDLLARQGLLGPHPPPYGMRVAVAGQPGVDEIGRHPVAHGTSGNRRVRQGGVMEFPGGCPFARWRCPQGNVHDGFQAGSGI